jgi:hypothetical protein
MTSEPLQPRGGIYVGLCVALAVTFVLAAALIVPSRADLRLDRRVRASSATPVLDEPTFRPPNSNANLPP